MPETPITYEDYRKCYAIAKRAHKKDRYAGRPYFEVHLKPIVDYFAKRSMWAEACLAALHDVVEDHGDHYTYNRLYLLGVPYDVRNALRCITRLPDEFYTDFIVRCKSHDLAWRVKIRDVLQNISYDPNRHRVQKYAAALLVLTEGCPAGILEP